MNFSFTFNLRVEVPELHKGLLSCDFTTEDILDVTNSLRQQMWAVSVVKHGKSRGQAMCSRHLNERSTTANYYFCV